MVKLIPGRTYLKSTNQGTFKKMCRYCGKSLNVAKGKMIEKIEVTKEGRQSVIDRKYNNDQQAKWHKECRKEGRRMEAKELRVQRKEIMKKQRKGVNK